MRTGACSCLIAPMLYKIEHWCYVVRQNVIRPNVVVSFLATKFDPNFCRRLRISSPATAFRSPPSPPAAPRSQKSDKLYRENFHLKLNALVFNINVGAKKCSLVDLIQSISTLKLSSFTIESFHAKTRKFI